MNNIKDKYPALCWNCSLARATWSEELELEGWVGCMYLLDKWKVEKDQESRTLTDVQDFASFTECGTGWISNCDPFTSPRKGGFFNNQIIIKGVKSCANYNPDNKEKESEEIFMKTLKEVLNTEHYISFQEFIDKPMSPENRHNIYVSVYKKLTQ